MAEDPFQSEDWRTYAAHVIDELVPMIRDSAVTVSLTPDGPSDVKFAVELGLSIMLDKPIIVVLMPGRKIPGKLVAMADRVVEGHPDPLVTHGRIAPAAARRAALRAVRRAVPGR